MENLEKQQKENFLGDIKISDFNKGLKEDVEQWKTNNQKVPAALLEKLKGLPKNITLQELLEKVRAKLFELYGEKRNGAKSFADSRFTSIDQMVERGMVSCGALTNIFGTILREFGIPVKFIHGGPLKEGGEKEDRHSWLEIYDPTHGKWFELDLTHPEFGMWPEAKRIKIYHDWSELKKDYKEGNF